MGRLAPTSGMGTLSRKPVQATVSGAGPHVVTDAAAGTNGTSLPGGARAAASGGVAMAPNSVAGWERGAVGPEKEAKGMVTFRGHCAHDQPSPE